METIARRYDRTVEPTEDTARAEQPPDLGLLLVQLGFHVGNRFREALAPLGLEPRHVGLLRRLATAEGQSQQALGQTLGITPNRMVFLVDDLEAHGLVERRRNPSDRRSHALYLTTRGRRALRDAADATAQHNELGSSLTHAERDQLVALLRRLAREQGINEHALPGPPPGRSARPTPAEGGGR
jgi:DNA-binding MarR family transcriptional regulator